MTALRTVLDRAAGGGPPLVMLTAYDVAGARSAAAAGVDLLLVGDSAAMVMLGLPDTTTVSVDAMLLFTRATARGAGEVPVIGDLPKGSYEPDDATACRTALRFRDEGGAHAVKLEGAGPMVERTRAITALGIPVVAHLGLTPQSVHELGGFHPQARSGDAALQLLDDALALEAAGAVALVLEAVPPEVAAAVTGRLRIPTIGIGAGAGTRGQVLVYHDLLGMTEGRTPRFVERYAALSTLATEAITRWAADVRAGRYPDARHTYTMPADEAARFRAGLEGR